MAAFDIVARSGPHGRVALIGSIVLTALCRQVGHCFARPEVTGDHDAHVIHGSVALRSHRNEVHPTIDFPGRGSRSTWMEGVDELQIGVIETPRAATVAKLDATGMSRAGNFGEWTVS